MDKNSNVLFERIRAYCNEEEQQLRIVAIANMISKQGLTQLFINPQETKLLASELVSERVLPTDYDLTRFEPENMHASLVAFLTKKLVDFMVNKGEITDEASCSKVFNDAAIALSVPPKNAPVLFSWLAEFVFLYKEEIGKALEAHKANLDKDDEDIVDANISMDAIRGFWDSNERQYTRLNSLYESALPCGMVRFAEYNQWLNKRDIEFRDFDVSRLIKWMPFDRYYAVAFNYAPTAENRMKRRIREERYFNLEPDKFKTSVELKVEVDELFRSMVYEDLKSSFIDEMEFYEADLSKLVVKTKKEKGMYICFLYLAAMIRVGYVESHRLDKLLALNRG